MRVTATTKAHAPLVGLTKADFCTKETTLARLSGSTRRVNKSIEARWTEQRREEPCSASVECAGDEME